MEKSRQERTVLVIDDDEGILNVTSRMMEKLGYHVLTSETGDRAIEIAGCFQGAIIAVMMDMSLPGIQGKELYLRLKEIRPEMKVIVCSGYADERLIHELLDMGADAYMQKPISLFDLSSRLKQITDRRKHQRYILLKGASAVINTLFSCPCKINDISMGGLSFFSEQPVTESSRTPEILLEIREPDFCLDSVPCSLIYSGNSRQPLPEEPSGRFGLEFNALNSEQNAMLAAFLQNHTI